MPDALPPRVLVVSHNPFSDLQSNGKTLAAFFEGWPVDRLAQLYFTLDDPAFTVCRRFFRVTDLDMLKATLGRPGSAGPVVEAQRAEDAAGKERLHGNRLYRLVRQVFQQRWPVALLARSLFWGRRRWASADLERWLDEVDPELVFFQSSNCTFAFDIVEDICRRRGIPLLMETTDDYVTATGGLDPFGWLHHRRISRAYAAAVGRSDAVIAIGELMAEEYSERFGGRYLVAMNSVDGVTNVDQPAPETDPVVLHFAGNLGLNRWRVLGAIGGALDELHRRHGIDARLEVYSLGTPEPAELAQLTASPRVEFLGSRDADFLAERRREATLLVHVESFDRKNRHITRLSVSTKIPEYLAANRAVLAVGPADVASIRYLADHAAGAVVTSPDVDALTAGLAAALGDPAARASYAARGLELVEQNHLKPTIAAMVRGAIDDAVART